MRTRCVVLCLLVSELFAAEAFTLSSSSSLLRARPCCIRIDDASCGATTTTRSTSLAFAATQNDDTDEQKSSNGVAKAALLIAGTTVGGGFLALPQTVVVPLGGFPLAAASLCTVWLFLLNASWLLCQCLVDCHSKTHVDGLGIVYLVQQTLGKAGGPLALVLLAVLTEATLVSQLARAGILLSESSNMVYQAGCCIAAIAGAVFAFGGNTKRDDDDDDVSSSSNSLATNSNAVLTTVFLISAVLLFQAGAPAADWSRCLTTSSKVSFSTLAKATPTMLQLLVYGEILPKVCHMLDYQPRRIRTALILGSTIPLILLTGWAALGVALLPPTTLADPVTVLLQQHGGAVQSRLYVLAVSAIGTTILGSYLALESAYKDAVTSFVPRKSYQRFLTRHTALAIVAPPLAVACISPSLFLRAIDFAGAYPVLLLYGVIPSLISLRSSSNNSKNGFVAGSLGLLSLSMLGLNAFQDIRKLVWW